MLREMMATGMLLSLCHGCVGDHQPQASTPYTMDHHSHAKPAQVCVVHMDLDLGLDFDAHKIEGTVTLSFERHDAQAPLILDVNGLEINSVTGADGRPRPFDLESGSDLLGDALRIKLDDQDSQVTVGYATRPEAAALQWLEPEQTAGNSPFLYTQGQAILTRTWIPLQDSPGVRMTFDARIRAPAELQVVMAAEQLGPDPEDSRVRLFRMPQAIPSYLVALACGELTFREISPRCGVWAAPTIAEAAAAEFEDMDDMLRACETLFGPYRWGRYDLLILPAAFPFGGMENPRLTFATPTIIAGDKSLVALVAHELAHSWSGNLVTNATWSDFWLNEGFTVYLEQRIMEAVFGEERARMETLIGMQALDEELPRLSKELRKLYPDLRGRDPDDNMTAVPYDKGAALLRTIEAAVGRPAFDSFLQGWFADHSFRSATTAEFLSYLRKHLLTESGVIDLVEWIEGTSIPADAHRPNSQAFEAVDAQQSAWRAGIPARDLETHGWVTHQWLHFLNHMPDKLESSQIEELDQTFDLTRSRNSEILAAWLRLCVRHGHRAADNRLEEFLLEVGRRKFLEPLYREMAKTPDGRERALSIYSRARPRYHAITQRSLDQTLKSP